MNAANTDFSDQEMDYKVEFRNADTSNRPQRSRGPSHARGKQPKSYNGIHRRRKKRIRW